MTESCPHSAAEPRPTSRWLASLPPWLVPVLAVVVALVAVVLRGAVGGVLMGGLTVATVVATGVLWRDLSPSERMGRLAVALVLAAACTVMLLPA